MWKNRNELPNLVKLNFKFDITKLKEEDGSEKSNAVKYNVIKTNIPII